MTHINDNLRYFITHRANMACEYCYLTQERAMFPHEIDHIYAEKHGGKTEAENLCLACANCNRYKGSDLGSIDPKTGNVVSLYHPRHDQWREHFQVSPDGMILGITPTGRVTEILLRFNLPDFVQDRAIFIKLGRFKFGE
jgi:hypothetical protein